MLILIGFGFLISHQTPEGDGGTNLAVHQKFEKNNINVGSH